MSALFLEFCKYELFYIKIYRFSETRIGIRDALKKHHLTSE